MKPEFDPSRIALLFFSRGRGRGHAVPDMAIVDELHRIRDDLDVRFASYATGAATLAHCGRPVIDLGLPERNSVLETLVLAAQLIGSLRPRLVVSHEEFSALPVAKIFDLPSLFITDWFTDPGKFSLQTLLYADEIIFIDDPGTFEEPEYVRGKVHYVGPVLREFHYSKSDQSRAREELGLPPEATIISVLPGSWATEQRAPIFDLVLPAFDAIDSDKKLLIWIAGEDYDLLTERTKGRPEIIVKKEDWQMDRLMVAGDLAITKTNRKSIKELASLGVPSISLSYGLNKIDDTVANEIPTNLVLPAASIDGQRLARHISEILANESWGQTRAKLAPTARNGRVAAAQRISGMIDCIQAGAGG